MKISCRKKSVCAQKGQAIVESVFAVIVGAVLFTLITTLSGFLYMQTNLFTAARQGARMAAIHPGMLSNSGAAIAEVQTNVQNYFQNTTGQTLPTANISVTLPTGVVGYRDVQVSVTYNIKSPIPLGQFLIALGAGPDAKALDQFSLLASARMRYEE